MIKFSANKQLSRTLQGLLVLGIVACGGNQPADNEEQPPADTTAAVEEVKETRVVYYGTPSLVEVASIMKNSGATFTSGVLNDNENVKRYTTRNAKALNMGVYGADLAYSAMFDETQESINYLNTIKSMSDDLGMGGAFEEELIQKIERNISNRDSLLDIITDFYWSADSYLMDNERAGAAAMIVVGGWMESIFIACHMAENSPENAEIRDRIAEQKLILNNLILLMQAQQDGSDEHKKILTSLEELQDVYYNVGVDSEVTMVKSSNETGETVIDNSTTVSLSEDDFNAVTGKIKEIREQFIQ